MIKTMKYRKYISRVLHVNWFSIHFPHTFALCECAKFAKPYNVISSTSLCAAAICCVLFLFATNDSRKKEKLNLFMDVCICEWSTTARSWEVNECEKVSGKNKEFVTKVTYHLKRMRVVKRERERSLWNTISILYTHAWLFQQNFLFIFHFLLLLSK
jgi:hypothetical protein